MVDMVDEHLEEYKYLIAASSEDGKVAMIIAGTDEAMIRRILKEAGVPPQNILDISAMVQVGISSVLPALLKYFRGR